MRRRIAGSFGLGNPDKELLSNRGRLPKAFVNAVKRTFFKEGFDFEIQEDAVAVGVEPTYQDDPLKIIVINKDKSKSYVRRGKAFGLYGSQVVATIKYYDDYKYKSKFIKFVDTWHQKLFGVL